MLTSPQRRAVRPLPADFEFPVEAITFATEDGLTLAGWFAPAPSSRRGVVLLHGNGTTRAQMTARAKLLRSWGYAVLAYDARGHGESGGSLVSVGWHEQHDLFAALDFLRRRGCREIGCIGVSQGGATIALAAEKIADVRWVTLESVYPDISTALDRRFRSAVHLPGWLAGIFMMPIAEWRLGVSANQIAPVKTVHALRCPVLVISGDRDGYTTAADTEILFEAASAPKYLWLVPGAAHVDLYGYAHGDYETRLRAFVNSVWPDDAP